MNPNTQQHIPAPWSYPWIRMRFMRHARDMLRLSIPIIFSRFAGYFMVIVDTIMITRFSKEHASWLVFGESPAIAFTGGCIGFIVGVPILVSRYYGANRFSEIGNIWRQGLLWSILMGALLTIACIATAKPIMFWLGDATLIPKAYPITIIYALSFIPLMIWFTCNGLLEATKNPIFVFIFSILANILNILFNWIFIYGKFGLPEMGAYGAALSTLLLRFAVAISLCIFIYFARVTQQYNVKARVISKFRDWKEQRSLGYAAAAATIAELSGFAILGMLSTRPPLNVNDTTSWAIALRVLALLFNFALGLSVATGVRVGIARGRKDFNDQIYAIIIGCFMTILALFILGFIAIIYAGPIAQLFSADNAVIALSSYLIGMLIWVFIPDGLQATLGQSLRTSGQVWITSALSIIAYGLILPICAYYFTFTRNHGIGGFMETIIIVSWFIVIAYLLILIINFRTIKNTTNSTD